MNETPQITITDTNGQSTQEDKANFPDEWMQALAFAEFVHQRLTWLPSHEAAACMNILASIITATNRPSK